MGDKIIHPPRLGLKTVPVDLRKSSNVRNIGVVINMYIMSWCQKLMLFKLLIQLI